MTKIVRFVVGLAVAAVVVLVAPGQANAHAVLLASSPAAGASVDQSPAAVVLTFSEPVTPIALEVLGPQGGAVTAGAAASGDGGRTVSVPLRPGLPDAVYIVNWQIVSADSHPLNGAFDFGVGAATPTGTLTVADTSDRWVDLGFGGARWLGFAGAVLLVGATTFLLAVWPAGRRTAAWRLPWVGTGLVLAASIAQLLLQGPHTGQTLAETIDSPFGGVVLLRLAVLAAAAALLAVLTRRPTTPADQVVLGAPVAVVLLATWPLNGHARAADPSLLAVGADTVHLTAVSAWLGGLVVLVLFVLRGSARDQAEPVVARFSSLALGSVAVIAATGTYQSWREVGSWPALPGTTYGRLLLFKVGLFGALIGLGWLARRWIRRTWSAGSAQLRLSVGAEVLVAAAVLALTAALVATEPARDTYSEPVHTTLALDAGDSVAVDVDPAKIGTNTVRLAVHGTDGSPRDVPEVIAEITMPDRELGPFGIPLQRTGPGAYAADAASFPYAGRWELAVTVRTTEFDQITVTTPVTVR